MEECSVLIETTKSAEDKTFRWFDLPIDYELFRDLLGVEADTKNKKIDVKMVSNQEKVLIIRKKKCCKPLKIKVCKKISKI